jgi:hypothetical protein
MTVLGIAGKVVAGAAVAGSLAIFSAGLASGAPAVNGTVAVPSPDGGGLWSGHVGVALPSPDGGGLWSGHVAVGANLSPIANLNVGLGQQHVS